MNTGTDNTGKCELGKRAHRVIEENRGSVLVIEASVYFPILIMVSVLIVMFFVFKLDKMMTQAQVSYKTMNVQMMIDSNMKYSADSYNALKDVSDVDDAHVIDAVSTSNIVYFWVNNCSMYPIEEIDYESRHGRAFLDVLSGTTCHGFVVYTNPFSGTTAMKDVSLFRTTTSCGTVVKGKTGDSFEDYLKYQYPYVSTGGGGR